MIMQEIYLIFDWIFDLIFTEPPPQVNDAKAKEKQGAVQKFRVQLELERDLPAHERRSAAKSAANMTPAAIANRMSQPMYILTPS